MGTELEIPPTPSFEVCGFGHGERRRETREEVAVVLAIDHTLLTHEALGRPYALSRFLEVVHRLVKDSAFVGHEKSIRVGILGSLGCFAFSREHGDEKLLQASASCSSYRCLVIVCVEVSGYGRCEPCQLRGTGRL